MQKIVAAIVATALACSAAACATNSGTQTINDFGRFQQIQPGATTKAQLHAVFGQPHHVQSTPEGSVWSFYQVSERMNASGFVPFVGLVTGGSDADVTRADFHFDANGILLRSERQQRSSYVNQWAMLAETATPDGITASVEREMLALGLPFNRAEAQRVARWVDVTQ